MKISKIIFMGTPDFAVPILQKLAKTEYKPVLCITQPDKPQGRNRKVSSPIVKEIALKAGIEVMQPADINSRETINLIRYLQPELIITAAYGGYIGREIRKIPLLGAVNIHPSLLPKYRGATPVNACLWDGEKITGVSIFRLVAKMDAGPILHQTGYSIQENDNYTILLEKLSRQAAEDIIHLIRNYEEGKVEEKFQDDNLASHCKKLEKEDFIIHWSNKAEDIHNQVRALAEKPGASTLIRNKPLKIISTRILAEKSNQVPGTVVEIVKNSGIIVTSGDYCILIENLQPAGKKIMSAYDYHLGARIVIGEIFGNDNGYKQ